MFKKLSTVLLALMLVAGLAFMGCGNDTTTTTDPDLTLADIFGTNNVWGFPWDDGAQAGGVLLWDGVEGEWVGPATPAFAGQVCILAFPNTFEVGSDFIPAPGGVWNTSIVDIRGANANATRDSLIELLNLDPPGNNFWQSWLGNGFGILTEPDVWPNPDRVENGGNGGEPEPATWEDVLDEFMAFGSAASGAHGADVTATATAEGILVANRTANHNGIGMLKISENDTTCVH